MKFYRNENGCPMVLIAPDYGAGWSTANSIGFAVDGRVVKKFIEEKPDAQEMENYLRELGYKVNSMAGYGDVMAEELDESDGQIFRIVEYDGAEEIEYMNEKEWAIIE